MAQIIQINPTTWRIEDDFVRFFLLVGEENAAMIDSGVNSPDALQLVKTITDKPVILLNTHGDGDHTSATGAFSKIHMHELDFRGCKVCSRYPNTSLVELNDNDIVDLGNRPLKVIHIPGHTRGSLAFLDVNQRVLIAGDSVQKGHIFMFGDKRDPSLYEASLDKLIDMNDEYDEIYASHDEFCLPKDYVSKVKEAWRQVRSDEVSFEMIDLFGNKIKSYTTRTCGFYLD